MDSRLQKCL